MNWLPAAPVCDVGVIVIAGTVTGAHAAFTVIVGGLSTIVKMQTGLVPLHAPLHDEKTKFAFGEAVRVTCVPTW